VIAGLVLLVGGAAAGVFGSLLGLGGGVLIVPLLTLGLGLHAREAVAVSLVSVIVTSSASASVYLERHVANLRLGMVLELFTAAGALVGGLIAFLLSEQALEALFAALLTWVAISMVRRSDAPARASAASAAEQAEPRPGPASFAMSLSGPGYIVDRLPLGMAGAVFAGLVSAVLGVGGGIVKVPVMHLVMGVPLKVATATSNMMIGITATSSAVIYLLRGEINPYVAGPTAVGVFVGAMMGSRIAPRVPIRLLRGLFVVVLAYTAISMAQKALSL
jgi:uncharacterized membrane protein YfcA